MTNSIHGTVAEVTQRIIERSRGPRGDYLRLIDQAMAAQPAREQLSCGNLAHGFARVEDDKTSIRLMNASNIGIVTAHNDMLSAHQPYRIPEKLKSYIRAMGSTAQVAGGVPAMCDGVTRDYPVWN